MQTLEQLITARLAAKRDEDAAVAARREIDEQIAAQLRNPAKTEGTVSQKIEGYKISVTYAVTRKAAADKLQKEWDKLPASVAAAFRWKPEVSTTELRKLEGIDATVAASFITTTPASASIKIEAV
jgi:predicted NUDIX family NTP pyrophosphohydrolase